MDKEKEIKAPEMSESAPSGEKTMCIKFNKEVKEIPLEEAVILAQKGLKFDAVSPILERIKSLAEYEGKSAADYIASLENEAALKRAKDLIDTCSSKEDLLEVIANLGTSKKQTAIGFDELQSAYPHIDDISKVPDEVLENAKLYGRNLFDEYLRYELSKKKREEKLKEALADKQSVGSQSKKDDGSFDPIRSRFLKGLWGN
jgi:hypothetical protein